MRFKATDEQVMKMCALAVAASSPVGMGFLHYSPDHTFEPEDFAGSLNPHGAFLDYVRLPVLDLHLSVVRSAGHRGRRSGFSHRSADGRRSELMEKSKDIVEAQVVERLPADLMLLKMENETIMSAARVVPRDPVKIVAQLQALIDAYPAAADEAIYSKPVGTVQEVTCAKCKIVFEVQSVDTDTECPGCEGKKFSASRKKKKFAEGLSIRAAESVRSIYGYTRLAVTQEQLEGGLVKIGGTLVDYAAGNLTSDERVVTPFYKSRQGAMVRMPEDRFLDVKVKAEKSKLRRDIILDSVPNIVKAAFRDACEKKLKELVSPEVIEQKILPAFQAFGVTVEQLERLVGRPHKLGWRESERLELRKVLTALQNEETTVHQLFADLDAPDKNEPEEKKGATMDDLMGTAEPPNPPAQSLEAVLAEPPKEPSAPKPEPPNPPEEETELAKAAKGGRPPAVQPSPPPKCAHPGITDEHLKSLPQGKTLVCACGMEFWGRAAPPVEAPVQPPPPKKQEMPKDPLAELFVDVHRLAGRSASKLTSMWGQVEKTFDESGGDIEAARAVVQALKDEAKRG
jgi:hypothetical protein